MTPVDRVDLNARRGVDRWLRGRDREGVRCIRWISGEVAAVRDDGERVVVVARAPTYSALLALLRWRGAR